MANSMAVNCFNFVYTAFFSTGQPYFTSVSTIVEIWLYPILIILPVAAIISRKIYRSTKNPYLPGLINALVITVISCTNTLTQY